MNRLIFCLFFILSLPVLAKVNPRVLSGEALKRLEKVPEFAFIQEEANRLGVKVYLFGGTASAFAHYVRWDLEREAGDTKYQKERFDYDFTNIYRGNQDLDIVVDGTAEQAAQLQQVLKENFPHFVGDKEAWEVRLLKAQIGDKAPLLKDPDFLNQHTDTNSTGMIAVNPDEGEIVFRDLFSWNDSNSQFLNDVAKGEIKFLFSNNHKATTRFKEGKNPPTFAAIRYLAKLAQYEVVGTVEDLELIKKIVKETDWNKVKSNSYLKHKLEEFGKKVLLNAPDSEYAWNLLDDVGLREKLIEMDDSRIETLDTLSWWMNKEPLRSKKIGEGEGQTAAELFKSSLVNGEIIVAHETNSFLAYENITRSSRGRANAFISRGGVEGETAAIGDGFYTRIGVEGARGTNLTIRFKLSLEAREGTDFTYAGDYIIVKNKNALILVQENLNISMVDFFKLVMKGEIKKSDKGLREKLLRKFRRISENSIEFKDSVKMAIDSMSPKGVKGLLPFPPGSFSDVDGLFDFFAVTRKDYIERDFNILTDELGLGEIYGHPEWIEFYIDTGLIDSQVASHIMSDVLSYQFDDVVKWVQLLVDNGNANIAILEKLFKAKFWQYKSELQKKWIEPLVMNMLKKYEQDMSNHPEIERLFFEGEFFSHYLWIDKPYTLNLVEKVVDRVIPIFAVGGIMNSIFKGYLSNERLIGNSQVVKIIDKVLDEYGGLQVAEHILSKEDWLNHPKAFDWIRKVVLKGESEDLANIKFLYRYALTQKHAVQDVRVVEFIEQNFDKYIRFVIEYILPSENWAKSPKALDWLGALMSKNYEDNGRMEYQLNRTFNNEYFLKNKDLILYLDGLEPDVLNFTNRLKELSVSDWRKQNKKMYLEKYSCTKFLAL